MKEEIAKATKEEIVKESTPKSQLPLNKLPTKKTAYVPSVKTVTTPKAPKQP